MFVKFKSLRFKNILSYGNVFEEINFENGLNLIKAPNGSGKSTILDSLTYVLFGKPFRNIKLENLVNRINDKQLVVEIEFDIGFDKWKIVRGEKPKILDLYKNNEDVNMLSSKKLVQEEIDKLLGINLKLFKNIVGIGVTNNKPFLSMPIWEKRELIGNIFNIDVLGDMAKEVKKRKNLATTTTKLKLTEIQSVENQIEDNKKYIENINSYVANFNETKEKDIENVQNYINECTDKISKNKKNIKIATDKLQTFLDALNDKPDELYYRDTMKSLGIAENEKKRIQVTIDKMNEVAVCPLCGNDMNGEHAKQHLQELQNQLQEIVDVKIPELKKLESEYNSKLETYNKNTKMVTMINQKKLEEELSLKNLTLEINNSKAKLIEIQNRECAFDISDYQNKLDNLVAGLNILNNEIAELKHNLEIDTQLVEILGDEGIKVYFFRKLIPILNQNVNMYLKKFNLPIYLEFDEQLQETIINGRNEMVYDQFSAGERTRIDMSVLLSFFNVSRIISNWSCSILFIDEILDSGIDKDGIEQFMSTLYNIVTENENRLGIYLVSHKLDEVKVAINKTIEIKKNGIFSEIVCK